MLKKLGHGSLLHVMQKATLPNSRFAALDYHTSTCCISHRFAFATRTRMMSAPFLAIVLCLVLAALPWNAHCFSAPSAVASQQKIKNAALVDVRLARIPQDLQAIRECRRSDPEVVSAALPKFLNAESLAAGLSTGIVVQERLYPFRVLGCTDVRFNEKAGRALIQNVYVINEARGLGLGKRMMEFVENLARSKPEMDRLELCVDTNNVVAVSLYEKLGFDAPGIHSVVNSIGKASGMPLQISMAKSLS
jgi:ribosomal protein S18 acetylase RimI-like enzyme